MSSGRAVLEQKPGHSAAPWLLLAFTLVLALIAASFFITNQQGPAREPLSSLVGDLLYLLSAVVSATVGAVIVARRPDNRIGWIILIAGLCQVAEDTATGYSTFALVTQPGALPSALIAAWFAQWLWTIPFAALLWGILLYPTGHLLSPRWRLVAVAGTLDVAALFIGAALASELNVPSGNPPLTFANPIGFVNVKTIVEPILLPGGFIFILIMLVAALASLVIRFLRARGDERQQIKWFTYAVALALATEAIAGAALGEWSQAVQNAAFLLVPLAIGLAILKYRLYDIDLIIRRTLVYAVLTAMLALAYFGSVVAFQELLRAMTGQTSDLAIVASTLVIAALFAPLRRGIQSTIDRRLYRRRYDAGRVLANFGATVRDEVDLARLKDELLAVVGETVQPTSATLWVKPMLAKRGE